MQTSNSSFISVGRILKATLWVIPFLIFLGGYQFMSFLYSPDALVTPSVIGLPLQEALQILSDNNLNPRLISQTEEPDLPAGTIISQTPLPGSKIKPHQSLFLAVSVKPAQLKSPSLLGKSQAAIAEESRQLALRTKTYMLDSFYPKDTCIGQSPLPNKDIIENKMIAYISKGNQKPVLLPNFKGKPVSYVTEILRNNSLTFTCIDANAPTHDSHQCDMRCVVNDQRPLAGSLIMLDKPLQIQLRIQHNVEL